MSIDGTHFPCVDWAAVSLFQIRQSEIDSMKVVGLREQVTGDVRVRARSHFGKRVIIRAKFTRTPTVISWEGQPIAGLTPPGLKLKRR